MRIDIGLNVRKSPTRYPAPTARPGMDIISVVGRTIELSIHDSASSIKRGKPVGSVQALVYYFAGEDYPSDPNGWQFAGPSTKAKFSFTVPDSVPGGTRIWLCAAWTNRSGEPGPTNVPISTNIQGGGTSVVQMKMAA